MWRRECFTRRGGRSYVHFREEITGRDIASAVRGSEARAGSFGFTPFERCGLHCSWSYLHHPFGWQMVCRSSAALACSGKAITLLCVSLGFEHPVFWAEKEAGLEDEVQGEGARDAASTQEVVPANLFQRLKELCWQTPLVQ